MMICDKPPPPLSAGGMGVCGRIGLNLWELLLLYLNWFWYHLHRARKIYSAAAATTTAHTTASRIASTEAAT
jgi:hypothetical protein